MDEVALSRLRMCNLIDVNKSPSPRWFRQAQPAWEKQDLPKTEAHSLIAFILSSSKGLSKSRMGESYSLTIVYTHAGFDKLNQRWMFNYTICNSITFFFI
jgi:hypothetical protein